MLPSARPSRGRKFALPPRSIAKVGDDDFGGDNGEKC